MSQPNLFGADPALARTQGSLFDGGRMDQAAPRSYLPDPADIRRRLLTVLEQARRAEQMPWSPRDARMWQTVFPQMANWLPEQEANQLRSEFSQEIQRLQTTAAR